MSTRPNYDSRILSSAQAINEALQEAGGRHSDVLLLAEGVDDPSSVYGTTKNLVETYGSERIIEMPIAENGLLGVAIGAAIAGKRPIISFQRVEFALLALEQIINNAAKMHYISNGTHKCPLVIRLVIGRGWGQGPEHSQSLETLFSYIPGLKVLLPVFPADYKGMLLSAIEDNNPVIVLEHRWTHYLKGYVPPGYYCSDITKPQLLKVGEHCTVVASSYSVVEALKAAEALHAAGITVDLFDLRVSRPLNVADIVTSVKKTGRLLTVDVGYSTLGLGSEVIACVTEQCFHDLKQPPKRIGLPEHPIPSSRGYLPGLYPNANKIVIAVCELVQRRDLMDIKMISDLLPLDIPDPAFQGPF